MSGRRADERTVDREALLPSPCGRVHSRRPAHLQLVLIGGIVRRPVAARVLALGIDLVGLDTAWRSTRPSTRRWLDGDDSAITRSGGSGPRQRAGLGPHEHPRDRNRNTLWDTLNLTATPRQYLSRVMRSSNFRLLLLQQSSIGWGLAAGGRGSASGPLRIW